MDLSLDEYIGRKKTADTVALLNIRKKEKEEIDPEKLDDELDEYMAKVKEIPSSGPAKFNRIKKEACSDEEMSADKCCAYKVKTKKPKKSQQWRLGANSGSQPVLNGRVGKNFRNNTGSYIEQGNFTYKYKNDESSGISGIVRNQRYHPANSRRRNFNNNNNPMVVDIKLNASDFDWIIPPPPPQYYAQPQQSSVYNQNDLLEYLKNKTECQEANENQFTLELF